MEFINNDGSGWGLPWEVAQKFSTLYGNWRIISKGGAVPGYLAHVAAIPPLRLSFALLVNGACDMEGWRDDALKIIVPALYSVIKQVNGYSYEAPVPENPKRYVGSYYFVLDPSFSVQIQLVNSSGETFLVASVKFGSSQYSLLLRAAGPDPRKLQIGSTFKGLSCMNSETMGFENQFVLFAFANKMDPNSPAVNLTVPGIVYGATLNRIG
jgi:hypothetical protein